MTNALSFGFICQMRAKKNAENVILSPEIYNIPQYTTPAKCALTNINTSASLAWIQSCVDSHATPRRAQRYVAKRKDLLKIIADRRVLVLNTGLGTPRALLGKLSCVSRQVDARGELNYRSLFSKLLFIIQ